MGIIGAIIIGFIIGLVAKMLMPGRDPAGFLITVLLGIGGAIVARWLGSAMGLYAPEEPAGFLASVIGSMVLLFVYRVTFGKSLPG